MSFLKKLFRGETHAPSASPKQQAVIVCLDGIGLPSEVYEKFDLVTIEGHLIDVIQRDGLGEFDGNDVRPGGAVLYMYTDNAERLFTGIEATLRGYPLCKGATVIVRKGGPGATQREIRL